MKKIDKLLKIYKFRNELGEYIEWTKGQKKIMSTILDLGVNGKRFVQIETPTRFGKSSGVAAALAMRTTMDEQWAIVAGTSDKAQVIMDYFIDFCLQNTIPRKLLEGHQNVDKLKQERSKRHLSFSSGFEIRVFSVDSRNKQNSGNAIMGFGAPYVILDEAALVDDVTEAKIFRMMAGFSTTKHLYLKIGNPFYRNHFWKSHNDPDYELVWFNYEDGIKEGRYTLEYIEKARNKPGFDVLYETKFPPPDAIDSKGWSPLLTEEDINAVMVEGGSGFGFLKVGIDPAGEGKNFNTVVKRYRNYAKIELKERLLDQFQLTQLMFDWQLELKRTEQILPLGYWVDKVGVGEGYFQTLRRDIENVFGVNVGSQPTDREGFVNLRAEIAWRLRTAIKTKQLQLEKNDDWYQLAQIKYRTKLEGRKGKIEIMSKQEMRANGIESPDVYDALALTFVSADPVDTIYENDYNDDEQERQFEKYAPIFEI